MGKLHLWDSVMVTKASEHNMVGGIFRITAVVKGNPDMYKLNFNERCWLACCLEKVDKL